MKLRSENPQRRERIFLLMAILLVVGLPATALGYEYVLRPALDLHRTINIRAAVPEAGGFQPDSIRVAAGETVTLRFRSVDVTHGIAIGPGLGIDLGHVDPGQVKDVTVTFDQAGTYTFYCNSWCSDNHWRMRGVIEAYDPSNPDAPPVSSPDPVIEALIAEGVDIDAITHVDEPDEHSTGPVPSAERGAALITNLDVPEELRITDWRRSHTPEEAAELLALANPGAGPDILADVVAYLWTANTSPAQSAEAEELYDKNCAACHGETGSGDGPAADTSSEKPATFSDPHHMLEMRGDVLYAKIRRGGMGTGMPNFGTLFTPQETWGLVDYLWALAFTETSQWEHLDSSDH